MSKRSSTLKRAKKHEREMQQYIWPDSRFGPSEAWKRPALQDHDLEGPGEDAYWWGEHKSYSSDSLHSKGGAWTVLEAALEQCRDAIARTPHDEKPPRAFAVIRVVGTSVDSPRSLVMVEQRGMKVLVPVGQFRNAFIEPKMNRKDEVE